MISFILQIIFSVLFLGIINRTRSLLSGRKGPGILQSIKDIVKLLRKQAIYSRTTSFVFQLAPLVYFATILVACLMMPLGTSKAIFSFEYDFVVFAYLLAFGRFMMIIAALDTGSSFEAMGASREAHYGMLAEPSFFILIGSLSLYTGETSFDAIFQHFANYTSISYGVAIMVSFVIFLLMLIETSRVPIDDPRTHLELTMIHEVMILDNSGFDLGLVLYATGFKFVLFTALIENLFLAGFTLPIGILLFVVFQVISAVVVGFIESFMARFRMNDNPQFVLVLSSLAFLTFIGILLLTKNI